MSSKGLIWIGMFAGSTVFGFLLMLWDGGVMGYLQLKKLLGG